MLKSEQKGRISALYKSRPARASLTDPRSIVQSPARAADARSQNFYRHDARSSVKLPCSSVYHCRRNTGWVISPLERPTPPLERTSNSRVPLERQNRRSSGKTKNWAKTLRFKTQPTYSQLAQHNPKLEHKEKGMERG